MAVVTTKNVELTPDDVLNLPDEVSYELVNGRLKEREMGMLSQFFAAQIVSLLWNYWKATGIAYVFTEIGYVCFPERPNRMRRPDVSCVRVDRLAFDRFDKGFSKIRPDLAVEVISPNDTVYDLEEKLDDYRVAGIPLVWLIFPELKRVRVIRPEGPPSELGMDDVLSGEEILPGFRCPVSDLFAGPVAAKLDPGH